MFVPRNLHPRRFAKNFFGKSQGPDMGPASFPLRAKRASKKGDE